MRNRLSARRFAVAWQWVVGLVAAGSGLLVAAVIGPLLVTPASGGAYALVAVTVVAATALASWGWDRITVLLVPRRVPVARYPECELPGTPMWVAGLFAGTQFRLTVTSASPPAPAR